MDVSIWNILIPAFAGIVGILIGSFKPFIDWQVHANKLRYDERKIFLATLRKIIIHPDFETDAFLDTIEYAQFRPHLSKYFIHKIEIVYKEPLQEVPMEERKSFTKRRGDQNMFLDEIARLEKEWKLL
jgi:hypothetical protein